MMPLLLLVAAFGITAVVFILLFWRYADHRVKQAYPEESPEALKKLLEDALEQQALLTARVEHLEAIVASEAWNASDEDKPAPPLALPDKPADLSNEEKVANLARRQRS